MIDLHNHCRFSFDSNAHEEAMVEEAIQRGIKIFGFTDHVDLDVPGNSPNVVDLKNYLPTMKALKEKYKDRIKVLYGLEIGMMPSRFQDYDNLLNGVDLDTIILSTHYIENRPEFYNLVRSERNDATELIITYYKQVLESAKYDNYDTLAHLDFLDRYFPDKSLLPEFKAYRDYVEKIFSVIIKKGKALEINAAGKRSGLNYNHPKEESLQLYAEMGGKKVTFGSDSHLPKSIGSSIKESYERIRKLGLTLVYFEQRKEKIWKL